MFSTVAIVVIAFAALFVVLLLIAATKPNAFRIERSATMKAPPEKVFALVNDFHAWGAWSPWEKIDPTMQRTFSGAASGKGAMYAWEGNGKAGAGRMEITESTPSSRIVIKLDFSKPFEAHNTAEFTFQPSGGSTNVKWAMFGPQAFILRFMTIFMNMDKMVGKDFETGLANIKASVEA